MDREGEGEVLGPDMVKLTEIMAVWVQVDMVARQRSREDKQILIQTQNIFREYSS